MKLSSTIVKALKPMHLAQWTHHLCCKSSLLMISEMNHLYISCVWKDWYHTWHCVEFNHPFMVAIFCQTWKKLVHIFIKLTNSTPFIDWPLLIWFIMPCDFCFLFQYTEYLSRWSFEIYSSTYTWTSYLFSTIWF